MYIVLEGIDGTGKSTQTKLLQEHLLKEGYQVETVVEPTKSEIGKLIRVQLKNEESTQDTNQQILALLFAADRLTLKDRILEVKGDKTKFILSDRSFYSSIAYQDNPNIDMQWLRKVNDYTPQPDMMILLDLDEDEAIKRCDETEVFETKEFLRRTRQKYLKFLEEENTYKIDASQIVEQVHEDICKLIEENIM
ncbi:MAG: dTMP kinase [Methanosphaera stadtmanae]|nr:dTMP kinase [Methanosphaera stadtmanae]